VVIVPCEPARIAFITYNGDVPISPKTIPMVIIMPAMEKALCAEGIFFVIRNKMGD
jgi:hypothetical protein